MNNELLTQHSALREGCGLWQGSATALLSLTGEDRVRLLNGLVTCEVKDLMAGQGVRGFLTDVKGHILAEVVVRAADSRLWLEVPVETTKVVADHIERYIVVDRVEVSLENDRQSLTLVGPQALAVLEQSRVLSPPSPGPWSHTTQEVAGHETLICFDGHFGVPGLTLWVRSQGMASVKERLLTSQGPHLPVEVTDAAIEMLQIEEGVPRFGVDFDTDNLPQETGLEDSVSYSKGCYLGQEVVARLHYRGQVAKCLRRLRSAASEPSVAGTAVLLEGREAGRITSAVASPQGSEVFALAMLKRRAMEPGTELESEGGVVFQVL